MIKEKTRTVRLKMPTIRKLDKIKEIRYREAIANKTFDIKALIKYNRGITFDKEIKYLSDFFLLCKEKFEKLPKKEKSRRIIGEVLKKVDRMNEIA